MHKIYFIYGTMFSGKTTDLYNRYNSYKIKGKKCLCLQSSKNTRDSKGIQPRNKQTALVETICFSEEASLLAILTGVDADILFFDEVQFMSKNQVKQLVELSKKYTIFCYGLKTTYKGDLFPAVEELLCIADTIQEIKMECFCCDKKATHNLLIHNGSAVYDGDTINIDGANQEDEYFPVCREHFFNGGTTWIRKTKKIKSCLLSLVFCLFSFLSLPCYAVDLTEAEIKELQTLIVNIENELTTAKKELENAQIELLQAKGDAETSQQELMELQETLHLAQIELQMLNDDLTQARILYNEQREYYREQLIETGKNHKTILIGAGVISLACILGMFGMGAITFGK